MPGKSKNMDDGLVFQVDVCKTLGPHNNPNMFVCDLDDFLEHYRPSDSVLDADVDRCFENIISHGLAGNSEVEGYHWTAHATINLLKKIGDRVLDFVKTDSENENNMHFMLIPTTTSDHARSSCFIAEPSIFPSTRFANNNASTFKKKKKHRRNDRETLYLQMLGACHHVMNEDSRRMWIYGLTFEENLCSLWYFSRSHSVKTKVFDWIKDPKMFVRVLLTFAKATPRKLGIDPTVQLILEGENKRVSFVYEVPPSQKNAPKRYYKTVQVLSNPHSMAIAGRTTRVWKVVEVKDASGKELVQPSTEKVLKDVWLDADSKTEAQNQDAIFAAVDKYVENGLKEQKFQDPDGDDEQLLKQFVQADPRFQSFDPASVDRLCFNLTDKAYRRLFLDRVHDWQGQTCKELGPNLWPCNDLFSFASLDELKHDIVGSAPCQSTVTNGTRRHLEEEEREKDDVTDTPRSLFAPKRQSRFIYRELCTTLEDLGTVGEVVDVLCQTMNAMHILFLAGWVHRDISSNNIMAYRSSPKEPWAVKLADLEFSRKMVDDQHKANVDPRTGTPYFMPVEVLSMGYLLKDYYQTMRPSGSKYGPKSLVQDLDPSITRQDYLDNLKHFKSFPFTIRIANVQLEPCWHEVPKEFAAVNYNHQHDLESIWWILLWMITCRVGHENSAAAMQDYFSDNVEKYHSRMRLFEHFLKEDKAQLLDDIKPLWTHLDSLRWSLQGAYLTREVFGHLKVPEAYSDIQVEFSTTFRNIKSLAGSWHSIPLQNDSSAAQKATIGKRQRESITEDQFAEDQNEPKRIRQ